MAAIKTRPIHLIRTIFHFNPWEMCKVLALLLVAGFLEGMSVLTLLPVVTFVMGKNDGPKSQLELVIANAFAKVGIEPNLIILLALIVVGMVLKTVLNLWALSTASRAAANYSTHQRLGLIDGVMRARWSFFTEQAIGRISNALTNESNQISVVYTSVVKLLSGLFQVLIYCGLAFYLSWKITALGVLVGGLIIYALRWLISAAQSEALDSVNLLNRLMSRLIEGLQLIKPLKAMAKEDRIAPLLENDIRSLEITQAKIAVSSGALTMLQEPIFTVFLAIGVYLISLQNSFTFAELIFIAVIFQRVVSRIGNLQVSYQKLIGHEVAYWSVQSFLDDVVAKKEPVTGGQVQPTLAEGIEFRNVSFSYGKGPILKEVSLSIPARKITLIIGRSGAGKSTFVDLISGLHSPGSGQILVDGTPFDQLNLRFWRSRIGYVSQDSILWNDSVLNNITLRKPGVDPQLVQDALVKAEAWSFVKDLVGGLDAPVGESGSQISGGQRQRLAIARALIDRPSLLILDEPTSSLDPQTELEICRTLRKLAEGCTVVLISHQDSLRSIADQIYEVRDGRILQTERRNHPNPAPL